MEASGAHGYNLGAFPNAALAESGAAGRAAAVFAPGDLTA
jgi:hypothetical protein